MLERRNMLVSKEEFYNKFPAILAQKLKNGDLIFPDNIEEEYEPIHVYRAIERKDGDDHPVDRLDFRSYFELKRTPKNPRGVSSDYMHDPHYYGVSSFKSRAMVEQKRLFPRPGKKLAEGNVYMKAGPQETNGEHVCWWLYENEKIEGFNIVE